MGEIVESKKRHYVGLDADKDVIPAGAKSKGDSYHANDKGKQYYWDGAAWKTGLGYEYVPLPANAWTKQIGDFVTDGTWKVDGLDFSGVVPAGATGVIFRINLVDDAADSFILIRTNAGANMSVLATYTQVANISIENFGILPIDSNRLLDYQGANLAFTAINVAVLGYFI